MDQYLIKTIIDNDKLNKFSLLLNIRKCFGSKNKIMQAVLLLLTVTNYVSYATNFYVENKLLCEICQRNLRDRNVTYLVLRSNWLCLFFKQIT